jgi:hypothetical protein
MVCSCCGALKKTKTGCSCTGGKSHECLKTNIDQEPEVVDNSSFNVRVYGLSKSRTEEDNMNIDQAETANQVIDRYLKQYCSNKPYLLVEHVNIIVNTGRSDMKTISRDETMAAYKNIKMFKFWTDKDDQIDKAISCLIIACRNENQIFTKKVITRVCDELGVPIDSLKPDRHSICAALFFLLELMKIKITMIETIVLLILKLFLNYSFRMF